MPTSLTEEEVANWCKNKKDYTPMIRLKDRTPEETEDMNRMAREYRDWNRYIALKNTKIHYNFNPKIHTSKIFDEFRT